MAASEWAGIVTTVEKLRAALEIAADKWGTDDCGCHDCARVRGMRRARLIVLLQAALRELA